jgi:hypothetical protein
LNATELPVYARRNISPCPERSDRKRHERFDYHLDAPAPRHNRSGALRSADLLASDRTRAAGIWIGCANVLATEMRRFVEMNKYLSIEEQRAFWTDLFAVTIRYEQRRCAATETYPDSSEGLHQDDARIADHSTRIAQGPWRTVM